jgi:transposase
MVKPLLTDELWVVIEPRPPTRVPNAGRGGNPVRTQAAWAAAGPRRKHGE